MLKAGQKSKQVDQGKREKEEGCTVASVVDVGSVGTEYWANEGSTLQPWVRFAAGMEKIGIDS